MIATEWHRESSPLAQFPHAAGSVVLVIGAYSGITSGLLIEQLPGARFYLLEPQVWACDQLRHKFGRLPNVTIHPYALGDRTATLPMALYTSNGCTFMKGSIEYNRAPEHWCEGKMLEFAGFAEAEGIESIYHASLNIEGYEYVLLPHLAKAGWLAKCQTLGVSWHGTEFNTVVPGPFTYLGQPVPTYGEMQELLAETHELVLQLDNWQTWVKR